jgi:hypothetical protein
MAISKIGDYTVGKYDENGKKLTPGKFVGTRDQVEELRSKYESHAASKGEPLVVPDETKKKSKKRKLKISTPTVNKYASEEPGYLTTDLEEESSVMEDMGKTAGKPNPDAVTRLIELLQKKEDDFQEEEKKPVTKKSVFFNHEFGANKLKVIDLISTAVGFMLIFENEDDISFYPKANGTYSFVNHEGEEFLVFYPGLLFDWTDNVKKVMILIRLYDEPEQDTKEETSPEDYIARYNAGIESDEER